MERKMNDTNPIPRDSLDADALDTQIKQAFEEIEPSAEAEENMLRSILDYQGQKATESSTAPEGNPPAQDVIADKGASFDPEATAPTTEDSDVDSGYADQAAAGRGLRAAGAPTAPPAPSAPPTTAHTAGDASSTREPATKKRIIPWKVIIPAAACLLLIAGVGALLVNNMPNSNTAPVGATAPTAASKEMQTQELADSQATDSTGTYATEGMVAAEADMAYAPYDTGYYSAEEYNDINEPGFIATATRPLSTFAADVDTASYANLRRLINDGYGIADVYDDTPYATYDYDAEAEYTEYYDPYYESGTIPKGAIRIEEMLNYFTYDYALPQGDDLFGTTVQLGDCPWNPDTKLLVMGFATNPEVGQATAGRNLVFLIDTSGSMDSPDKMDLLQDAFAELTDQLNDNDRISIVTYSGYEEVVLDGAKGSDARQIQRAIDKLRPDGSTNGEAGLKMAYEVAERNFIEGGVNRIILASDGDLNVGMSSESDLHDFVENKRDTGIYLSVLGFGTGNYKDNKMETLADAGNGNYHYIDCLEEAEKVFGKDLVSNLIPLANDVKLQVEFNPAQVKGYRLIGYENRALNDEDFRDDSKDAGDVGPGHQLTVAYEIVPIDSKMEIPEADLKYGEAATGDAASSEWLTCTMRYQPVMRSDGDGFVVEASDAREQNLVVSKDDLASDPGDDWRFAASVIEFGMVMRDSDYKGNATLDTVDALLSDTDLSSAERKDFQRLVRKAG